MLRKVSGFSIALAVLSVLPAHAEQKPWTEVKSPQFRVITDASERDARDVAAEFEQMRYVFCEPFFGVSARIWGTPDDLRGSKLRFRKHTGPGNMEKQ
jgi:hypothetical protein